MLLTLFVTKIGKTVILVGVNVILSRGGSISLADINIQLYFTMNNDSMKIK